MATLAGQYTVFLLESHNYHPKIALWARNVNKEYSLDNDVH